MINLVFRCRDLNLTPLVILCKRLLARLDNQRLCIWDLSLGPIIGMIGPRYVLLLLDPLLVLSILMLIEESNKIA